MKRFHVHLAVRDLSESVRFYSALFAIEPSVLKPDYAKWMLEDPRVNFAISTRSGAPGIDHLGIQAEDAGELAELGLRLDAAGQAVVPEAGAECCHARSDKMWTEDPQGTRWETFHTVGSIATYHGASGASDLSSARGVDLKALSSEKTVHSDQVRSEKACCGPMVATIKKVGCAVSGCRNTN
jgi:catechol 2,3-dioxygenase-like lactoylglutathione lyase family enzyme